MYKKLFLDYYNDPFAWARGAPEGRWSIRIGDKEYKTKADLKEATENSQKQCVIVTIQLKRITQ